MATEKTIDIFFRSVLIMPKRKLLGVLLAAIMILALMPAGSVQAAQTTVTASTAEELINAIASDTTIVLLGDRYEFDSALLINAVENLSIAGTENTEIVIKSSIGPVLELRGCNGVTINNIFMGHDTPNNRGCGEDASVITISESKDVLIAGCILYGCGRYGFAFYNSEVTFDNTRIIDCSDSLGIAFDSVIVFNGCAFENNGYQNDDFGRSRYGGETSGFLIWVSDAFMDAELITFNTCLFAHNRNTFFKAENGEFAGTDAYNYSTTRINDCTFTDNAWELDITSAPPPDIPDDWAFYGAYEAVDARLVPKSISNAGWKKPTTRVDAAEAMVLLIERVLGQSIEDIAKEKGWDLSAPRFNDTDNVAVTFLGYAGIVQGEGGNNYNPDGVYIRAYIVTMIGKVVVTFFGVDAGGVHPFTDVPDYAAQYVGYAYETLGIKGTGDGKFDPDTPMQNQATAFFSNLVFNALRPAPEEYP